ncbi:hypothetical protein [Lewinella cohaerens]|uniref:hypothetical protein n=1 Tax=Lewinella cohaerens TaxID=70995 RepID=UPI0012EC8D42|nr:hypothetical protein [Lewinella cohaerens]
MDNNDIEQLLYKRYNVGDHLIRTNNQYKVQLNTAMSGGNIGIDRIDKLTYEQKSLVRLFTDYNKLNGKGSKLYTPKKEGKNFHLSIRPGLQHSSISITNTFISSNFFDLYWEEQTTLSKSEVKTPNLGRLPLASSTTLAFGGGYCFANKVSIEIRQRLNKNVFQLVGKPESDYTALSLIFGYTIL